ncbi:MAG TPA: TadE/TadG family type IV pilus assembly protein [Vicinamibacterales bacterium]
MRPSFIRALRHDQRGAALIEFALVTPVMLVMLMGFGDMLYQVYTQSILDGELQKAARDSGIEGGAANTSTIDAKVQTMVKKIAPGATFTSTRKSYDSFSEVAPEPFTDANGNGVRDPGECFTDENGNGTWDQDPGIAGQGGASAVTVYTMTATYPRLFPVAGLLGWPQTQTVSATTLLKNQPYATQATTANVTVCT